MSEHDLTVPSVRDQDRLKGEWQAICEKIDASPTIFRLQFGKQFDSGFCILRDGEGWMVLDIVRGNEQSRIYCATDDELLYEYAKVATNALSSWARTKHESSLSRVLGTIFHRLDPLLDTRLQLRQQRRQIRRIQLHLMERISARWKHRLVSEYRSASKARV